MLLIKRKMSQLLVVDAQDKVLAALPDKQQIISNMERLIIAANRLEVPVAVSEHYPAGLGQTADQLRQVLDADAALFDKIHFSCLKSDPLRHHLEDHRDHGRGQIIIAGIETHVCFGQTALDLIADGYQVFAVADATGSRSRLSSDLALQRLQRAGAFIVDSEMVMFEWLERADTAEFKALLPLIKSASAVSQPALAEAAQPRQERVAGAIRSI